MNGSDIYAVCVEWAHRALNPEYWATKDSATPAAQNIRVVQSRKPGGAPADNYISIPVAPGTSTTIGEAYNLTYNGTTEVNSTVTETRGDIQLREVGGSGDNLRKMLRYLYLQEAKDFLTSYQCSILLWGSVNGIPRLDEQNWKEEWVVAVSFLIATQTDESTTYIEDVNITKE